MLVEKIECIIVEDDLVAQSEEMQMIHKINFLDLKKSFNDPIEASVYLRENHVDLIFLDIELPNISGLQLIDMLDYKPMVIIITTQQKYAIEAFSYGVCDYLLRPLDDYSRFFKAALRAQATKNNKSLSADTHSSLFVKVDSLLYNINVDSIRWVEAYGDYVKIYINTEQKFYMVLTTLKSIETKLSEIQFIRVHRSYIVNVRNIDNMDANTIQMGTKVIPIGANYRDVLIKKINLL